MLAPLTSGRELHQVYSLKNKLNNLKTTMIANNTYTLPSFIRLPNCVNVSEADHRKANVHTRVGGTKPLQCHACGKIFEEINRLNHHIKRISKQHPHRCSYCCESFFRSGSLLEHIAHCKVPSDFKPFPLLKQTPPVRQGSDTGIKSRTLRRSPRKERQHDEVLTVPDILVRTKKRRRADDVQYTPHPSKRVRINDDAGTENSHEQHDDEVDCLDEDELCFGETDKIPIGSTTEEIKVEEKRIREEKITSNESESPCAGATAENQIRLDIRVAKDGESTEELCAFRFDDEFVLRTWKITTSENTIEKIKARFLNSESTSAYNTILQFLRGNSVTASIEQMTLFLENEPQCSFEEGPICMMLFDFCAKLSVHEIAEFYVGITNSTNNISVCFELVVLQMALHKIQEQLKMDCRDENVLTLLPTPVMDKEMVELINSSDGHFIREIPEMFHEIISETTGDRRGVWNCIATKLVSAYVEERDINILEFLLLDNLENADGEVKKSKSRVAWHGLSEED